MLANEIGLRTPLEFLTDKPWRDKERVASLSKVLLDSGALPTTPVLINAVQGEDAEVLKMALAAGGNPNTLFQADGCSILRAALARQSASCAVLLIQAGADATWDELCIAAILFHELKKREALANALVERLCLENDENSIPPRSLILPPVWNRSNQSISTLFEFQPYDYCSLGILSAVVTCLRSSDLSLIEFLLWQRHKANRRDTDVFEGAAVAFAAISRNNSLFKLLSISFAPVRVCALISCPETQWKVDPQPPLVIEDKSPLDLKPWIEGIGVGALLSPREIQCRSPLLPSIIHGEDEMAMEMMELGYQPDIACLIWAVLRNRPSLAKDIISRRPLLDTLQCASRGGPLYMAVKTENLDILRILLEGGITHYESGSKPPLWVALKHGKQSMIDMLLAAGVSINSPAIVPRQRTPLQQAVESKNVNAIYRLLEAGADVNQAPAPKYGATALQLAALTGQVGIAKALIEHGADVNAPGARKGGRTALEAAAEHGRLDTAQMLLEAGFETTRQGRLAYVQAVAYAEDNCHFVLAGMLRKHRPWTSLDDHLMKNLELDEVDRTYKLDPDFCCWDEDMYWDRLQEDMGWQ
jgi:hypothetical protein